MLVGDSFGRGVSSTAEEMVWKEKPASRRISARRGEAEARISFMLCQMTTDSWYSP